MSDSVREGDLHRQLEAELARGGPILIVVDQDDHRRLRRTLNRRPRKRAVRALREFLSEESPFEH